MRIIGGYAKGRKLFAPSGDRTTRPTTDRAKEALFSIIGAQIVNSRFLDLFAGSGAIGCEALSRGASYVCFVENNKVALNIIKKNILLVPESSSKAEVISFDLRRGLPVNRFTAEESIKQFDYIFADPPYERGISEKILHTLDDSAILSDQVSVIVEERKNVYLPVELSNLSQIDRRKYGDSVFYFYKLKNLNLK